MTVSYNSHIQSPQTRERISTARQRMQRKKDGQKQLWVENRVSRSRRTPEQQLASLDFRLGKNVGANRERQKLKEQVANRHKKTTQAAKA